VLMLIVVPGRKEQSSCLARACLVSTCLACMHALKALDICVSDAIKKKDGGALREQCSYWNTWGAVICVTVELRRFHTKSRSSVPKGTLLPHCSKRNTAPKFLKIVPFLVSSPVIIMTLFKNRF
jgi:hypothetical protein